MNRKRNNSETAIPANSMADIAFLLLIFFLVTTTITEDKGLMLKLPPHQDEPPASEIHERNLFKVHINSINKIMVEGELIGDTKGLRQEAKDFILNPHGKINLSESPEKAVVSIKTNRGTSYHTFISVLDEIQAAYYEIYASKAGISAAEFRRLDNNDPKERLLYEKGRAGIPMNISIAEPER